MTNRGRKREGNGGSPRIVNKKKDMIEI